MAPSSSSSSSSASIRSSSRRQASSTAASDDDKNNKTSDVGGEGSSATLESPREVKKRPAASTSSKSQRPKPGPKQPNESHEEVEKDALLPDVTPSPPPPKKSKGSLTSATSRSKSKVNKPAKKDSDKPAGKELASEDGEAAVEQASEAPDKKKKARAPRHQVLTERDEIPKLWKYDKAGLVAKGSYPMKIASWNVCGLRALLNKSPDLLAELVRDHDVDVLCLQETKLQSSHVDELGLSSLIEGYDAYYSCSTARKGYSGTAAFVRRRRGVPSAEVASRAVASAAEVASSGEGGRKKQQKTLDGFFSGAAGKKDASSMAESADEEPATEDCAVSDDESDDGLSQEMRSLLVPESVSFAMGIDKHDAEGRLVILNFPSFSVCNLYVPNSGAGLVRLPYRVNEWDKDWLGYCQEARKARPVLWLGDLNVAHTNLEVWNDGAPHLPRQAGVTAEERGSFQHQLDAGFFDAFRRLHPHARGHYSYWSQRANNRPSNKGLRLDYFVCDRALFPDDENDEASDPPGVGAGSCKAVVRDSYILHDVLGSDHCPVVLELEVKL